MLGQRYKDGVSQWSEPLARLLVRASLKPNQLTVLGLGVSFTAAVAYGRGQVRLGGLLTAVAGGLDILDGAVARASGQVTFYGAFLDSVLDRYSDLIILFGIIASFLYLRRSTEVILAMATVLGSVMVSYTRARAEGIGISCNVGLMERGERMLILIAGSLLDQLPLTLWVLAPLTNLTALQRIHWTWQKTRLR
jgi:CDP-diacylglycerol--glycerol-3-phosphate 3-phosphatidyltransferase